MSDPLSPPLPPVLVSHVMHTLAQYISDSDHYFKSNNNTVFWLLSGTHNISMPVIIRDAHSVTLKRYGAGVEYPRVVFSPTYYCTCEASINGACKECSAIQFYNVCMATVSDLVIIGKRYNKTSSINGLSFERSNDLIVQNITVVILQNNACYMCSTSLMSGFIFFQTSNTDIHNISTSYGRVVLHKTIRTLIQSIAIKYSEMFSNVTTSTEISDAIIANSYAHGISSRGSTNMTIKRARITNAKTHCIRLEDVRNTSIAHANNTHCGRNGIHIEHALNTQLNDMSFLGIKTNAITIRESTNTNITNTSIENSHFSGIELLQVYNTSIRNTTIKRVVSSVLCDNVNNTSFSDLNVMSANTGIHIIQADHTSIVNSTFSINSTTNDALSFSISTDTLIRNVSVTSSISINNCTHTTFDLIKIKKVTTMRGMWVYKSFNVYFVNISFVGLGIPVTDVTDHPAVVVLYRSSFIHFSQCHFSQNTMTSLKAVASNFTVSDSLTFTNNTAPIGAAMILQEKSKMKLLDNSSLLFTGNHATSVGGAIYVDTNAFYVSKDSSGVALSSECIFQTDGTVSEKRLVFENNSAESGGNVVYGGLMGLATTSDKSSCLKEFKVLSRIDQTNTLSAISSQPSRVCLCNLTGRPDCMSVFYTLPESVYPGQTVYLPAVVVGQDFGTGTGSVYAQFLNTNNADKQQDKALKQWQYTQGVSQDRCNQLTYSILAVPANDSTVLVLSAVRMNEVTHIVSHATVNYAIEEYNEYESGIRNTFPQDLLNFPLYVNISVLPCPTGFTLSSQWPYKCECNRHLRQLPGVKCSIQNLTFERSDYTWIGLDGEDGVVVSKYCPYLFCKENRVNVTLDKLDVQCNYNHSGQLCGGCKPGLSLALGSNQCLHCSNRFLFLLIPMALAGIVLVFAIKILDITVSHGYLNGLVFFFNIVHSARPAFIPQGHNNPLAILVALTNLDMGIETCFFDGLSAYWKSWLQFVFPLYIWGISGLIIISAKYSNRISKLMGNNPVSVLATLFLLSYTKLLRTSILTMSYSIVMYPNDKRAVWSLDGNIDYLGPKHLPLFAVAVAVLFFLCLPYTLILLLGQWLCQCNNRHISHMMFRIKPFLDAYYGPLKDKHRYWIGLLLISRAMIHVVQAVVPNKNPSVIVLAVSITVVVLLQLTAYVLGFYRSRCVSTFEVTVLSNLILFCLAKLYTLNLAVQTQTLSVIDNLFLAAVMTQLSGLVLFQMFSVTKRLLPHQCTTMVGRWFSKPVNHEEDWEVYEEASLMRHMLDDEDVERVPINTNNIPTYGI